MGVEEGWYGCRREERVGDTRDGGGKSTREVMSWHTRRTWDVIRVSKYRQSHQNPYFWALGRLGFHTTLLWPGKVTTLVITYYNNIFPKI